MATITGVLKRSKTRTVATTKVSLWERYLAYVASKKKERMLWYMKSIILIPCVIMVPSIFAMAMVTSSYIWFVWLTVILFFSNIIVHIVEMKNTIYIPVYHASIAIMVVLPIIAYLFS